MKDLAVYVLVRTDLPSLNSGKAMAQSQHSGVQLAVKYFDHPLFKEYISTGVEQGADNFNTTITLAAKIADIEDAIGKAKSLGYLCDIVVDPSYPFLVDSELDPFLSDVKSFTRVKDISHTQVLYTRSELTCAYALGDRNDPEFLTVFANLNLHS
jgi:peptidyl-tRNA hydrolase